MRMTATRLAVILLLLIGLAPAAFGQGWGSCATYEDYLHWVGVSGPFSQGRDVVVNGDHAYVAAGYNGIATVDVSDPTLPRLQNMVSTGGDAQGVAIAGLHLLVADLASVVIMSLENPASPVIVSTLSVPEAANIAIVGNLAVVARRSYGVSIVDLSDPTAPVLLGTVDTPGSAYALAVDGTRVHVADYTGGMQVVDISDPMSPVIMGSLQTAGAAYSIARHGDVLAVGCDNALQFIDVATATAPVLLSSQASATVHDIWMDADRGYLACGSSGVVTMDVSNPRYPSVIGRIATTGSSYGVDVVGHAAFVAEGTIGLLVVNSANDMSPPVIGRVENTRELVEVAARGNYAYFLTSRSELRVVDCSDPAIPVERSVYSVSYYDGYARDLAIADGYAYIATAYEDLLVVDISNPDQLHQVGSLHISGINDVVVANGMAYLATYYGLKVVDVSNPWAPVLVSELSAVPGYSLDTDGEIVVVGYSTELKVVGVSDPRHPRLLGSVSGLTSTGDIDIEGSLVAVAAGSSGLTLVDISVPSFPVIVRTADTPGYAYAVSMAGPNVVIADGYSGAQIMDVSNTAQPRLIGSIYDVGDARDVSLQADYIFTATSNRGLSLTMAPCPNLNLVTVSGSIGGLTDSGNLAGVRLGATAGFDSNLESLSPPSAPGSYLDVSFHHPEWMVPLGEDFNADLRPPYDLNGDGQVWPLRVQTDQTGAVTLTFSPNFGQGTGWGPWLRDLTSGMFVSLAPVLEYTFEAHGSFGDPDVRDFELVMGGPHGIPPLTPEHRELPVGWSMIGLPLLPPSGHQTWGDVLLDDTASPVYLYSYNADGHYGLRQGYDAASATEGLWVGALAPFTWSMDGTPDVGGVSVPLRSGWNLIGYPLWVGSDLSGVMVDHAGLRHTYAEAAGLGLVAGAAVDYDNTTRAYVPVTSLATWHGYWLSAYEDSVSLWFDYRNATAGGKHKGLAGSQKSADNWSFRLAATGNTSYVSIGSDVQASDGFDALLDLPSPPAMPAARSTDVSMFIGHPEWNVSTGAGFLTDYVSTGCPSYVWEVQVIARGAASVALEWDPELLAAAGHLEIRVPSTGQVLVTSMRDASSCIVPLANGRQTLEVRLNSWASPAATVSTATRLVSNYPNPFNPSTTISFDLAVAGDVSLQVFDASGRLVRVLAAQQGMPAGRNELAWDGRDDGGRPVAGGVYFYRLDAGEYRETRKMILVK